MAPRPVSVVVDASVWVAGFIADDVRHEVTTGWLADSGLQTLVTPVLALAETSGAVARRTGSLGLARRAVAAIEHLPNVVIVVPDTELWTATVRAASGRALRGSDALYVALAGALRLPLVTWDREQQERSGRRVTVMTPQNP